MVTITVIISSYTEENWGQRKSNNYLRPHNDFVMKPRLLIEVVWCHSLGSWSLFYTYTLDEVTE